MAEDRKDDRDLEPPHFAFAVEASLPGLILICVTVVTVTVLLVWG
jgi:hypothetical protein